MICPDCGGRKYRRNTIHESRLLGSLTLGIWGGDDEDEAEAETAAQTAIKLLVKSEAEDLPNIRRIFTEVRNKAEGQPGSSIKLRAIWEEAARQNAAFSDVSFDDIIGARQAGADPWEMVASWRETFERQDRRREQQDRRREQQARGREQRRRSEQRAQGQDPYIRRAAALGDARSQALGLEPWPTRGPGARRWRGVGSPDQSWEWWKSILRGLPQKLLVSFAADVAERVLPIFEAENSDSQNPRLAIEAARRWADDPSEVNADAARQASAKSGRHASSRSASAAAGAAAHAATAAHTAHAAACAWSANDAIQTALRAIEWAGLDRARDLGYLSIDSYQDAEIAWQKQRLIQYLLGDE